MFRKRSQRSTCHSIHLGPAQCPVPVNGTCARVNNNGATNCTNRLQQPLPACYTSTPAPGHPCNTVLVGTRLSSMSKGIDRRVPKIVLRHLTQRASPSRGLQASPEPPNGKQPAMDTYASPYPCNTVPGSQTVEHERGTSPRGFTRGVPGDF